MKERHALKIELYLDVQCLFSGNVVIMQPYVDLLNIKLWMRTFLFVMDKLCLICLRLKSVAYEHLIVLMWCRWKLSCSSKTMPRFFWWGNLWMLLIFVKIVISVVLCWSFLAMIRKLDFLELKQRSKFELWVWNWDRDSDVNVEIWLRLFMDPLKAI